MVKNKHETNSSVLIPYDKAKKNKLNNALGRNQSHDYDMKDVMNVYLGKQLD